MEALIHQYIYIFGSPKTILTDQGTNFLSELMDQFEKALRIKHVKTTAFHPQANGNIKRMHSTLNNLIKSSTAENQNDWDENLKYVTHHKLHNKSNHGIYAIRTHVWKDA